MTTSKERKFKSKFIINVIFIFTLFFVFSIIFVNKVFSEDTRETSETETHTEENKGDIENNNESSTDMTKMIGLLAAAVAFGFGAIGAGIAVSNIGAAAMGAIGEKPEIAGQALLFVALADGLVVFGFITALMILGKI